MKKVILLSCSLLGACSSPYVDNSKLPDTKVLVEKEVTQMSRNQVIMAVQECDSSGLRPVVIMSRRKINGYLSDVPVDVTCMPKFGR
jgi:cellobiose-specific phosphotransferase system component IIB